MKKILSFSLLVFLLIGVYSCSNDDGSGGAPLASDGEMIAEVDGVLFTSNTNNTGAIYYQNMLSISGTNSLGTILLTIPDISGEGTFDLAINTIDDSRGVYTPTGEDGYISFAEYGGSGQLIITKFDLENELVSGTFKFTAIRHNVDNPNNPVIETVEITNGSFTNVQILVDDIPGNANNSLSAKVDGDDFNPNSVNANVMTISGNSTIMVVANNTTTNQNISLAIPSNVTIGTHQFSSLPGMGGINGFYSASLGNSPQYISISGSINITNYDVPNGTMEGTFFFTAGDFLQQDPTTYEITNGVFEIEF